MTTLTFIIADERVPRLQVDVVLSALTFTALQPALCAQTWAHFLHAEATMYINIMCET